MATEQPIIGLSIGDTNSVSPELLLRVVGDYALHSHARLVVFGGVDVLSYYRQKLGLEVPIHGFSSIKMFREQNFPPTGICVVNCWETITPVCVGQPTTESGECARKALTQACVSLQQGEIDGLVTMPIHKYNIQAEDFSFSGHTPFLRSFFHAPDAFMMMVGEQGRVALLSEHLCVRDAVDYVTKENIIPKIQTLKRSLQEDFQITKPKIAVLGVNPHCGDGGVCGTEEQTHIMPAIDQLQAEGDMFVFGPYSADGFFAHGHTKHFDAVLAMYHDQGMIGFKTTTHAGVNYTAGLAGFVRTSPDHGTAFDIACQNRVDPSSTYAAIFTALDILRAKKKRHQPT